MRYKVQHKTTYSYSSPVTLCYNMAHLLPRDTVNQRCFNRKIQVTPKPLYQNEGHDYFGNETFYFSIQEPHKQLTIDVTSFLEVQPHDWAEIIENHPLTCGELRDIMARAESPEIRLAQEFCLDSLQIKRSENLSQYAQELFSDDQPVLKAAMAFTHKIFTEFTFDPTATDVTTPTEQVLKEKRGVCQDYAQLAIGCLRSVGLAARYMSGYIETLPPPGKEKLVGTDASHAWFAIFVPDLGWVEFDPTNDLIANEQHIVTGWGRDYADVAPLQGVIFDGGETHNLSVSVDVARV
ncbi:transglutaminase family protein [Vibrio natriegens]|uniref:transglutaminase family protein n=1 Tax=Vibrio natriegens TaxID=691 RepID=UPI00159412C7|nr:transglutaminase family protein [Vibrio natriegens]NVC93944.1 transglutaminase family protein [Vibrio natriegens]